MVAEMGINTKWSKVEVNRSDCLSLSISVKSGP